MFIKLNSIVFLLVLSYQVCAQTYGPDIQDADGNTYKTVKIDNLYWMASNLRTTKGTKPNGTTLDIRQLTIGDRDLSAPGMYWHGNDKNSSNSSVYGPVYNWKAIVNDGTCDICPKGWRIPKLKDWRTIYRRWYLSEGAGAPGMVYAAKQLRSKGTDYWPSNNQNTATNTTGFTALPGGWLWGTSFSYFGRRSAWWGYNSQNLSPVYTKIADGENGIWSGGASSYDNLYVRCVKDVINKQKFTIDKGGKQLKVPYHSNFESPVVGAEAIDRLIIVIHGTNRNGDDYYENMKDAANYCPGTLETTRIIAPTFMTNNDVSSGSYGSDYLSWVQNNDWKEGGDSKAFGSVKVSSFEVIDAIIEENIDQLPNLKQVVLAGHSAGGQFVQRYMASSKKLEDIDKNHSTISYLGVVSNPSSYLYLNNERVQNPDVSNGNYTFGVPTDNCSGEYNNFKYGLDNINVPYLTNTGVAKIKEYHKTRKVIYLLGEKDTKKRPDTPLDESCSAMKQGPYRYKRGKIYEAYLKKYYANNPAALENHTFYTIPGVGHDNRNIFGSATGYQIFFPCGSGSDACSGFKLIAEYEIDNSGWIVGDKIKVNPGQRLEVGADPNYLYEVKCTLPDGSVKSGTVKGSFTITSDVQSSHAGTYTITAKDSKGCSAQTTIQVTVQ